VGKITVLYAPSLRVFSKGDGKATNIWNAVVAGIQLQRKKDVGLINFFTVWSASSTANLTRTDLESNAGLRCEVRE